MTPERFWELVDHLGGVADETTVPRLEAALREGEADAFTHELQDRVEDLLGRVRVAGSHTGDVAEWLAAAVVASGRESFERLRAAGAPLDPDAWAWEDAEALLVAGTDPDAEGPPEGSAGAELGLALQWQAATPPGVTTAWSPTDEDGDDPGRDDPDWGTIPCEDPAWDRAVATLAADPELLVRRALIESIALHVVVREADEATLTAYPENGTTTSVVLALPAAEHRGPDGAWLAEDERVAVHVDAVATLVVETAAALDLDPAGD